MPEQRTRTTTDGWRLAADKIVRRYGRRSDGELSGEDVDKLIGGFKGVGDEIPGGSTAD